MRREAVFAGGLLARYLLLGSTLFLVLAGIVMVYSASSVVNFVSLQDSGYHLRRQVVGVLVGVAFLLVAMTADYRKVRLLGPATWLVSVLLLVVVLVDGVGKWGATRWIDVGPLTIQPSELAKMGCAMVAALLVHQYGENRIAASTFWKRLGLTVGIVAALVLLQPDLGTTVAICVAVYVALLIGGVNIRLLGGVLVAGVGAIAALIAIAPYRMRRVTGFLDPFADPLGAGYQSIQALYAFGSGGLDGVGLGMSRQKLFYLPAAHTDFIFAIIGEELGLIGTLSVVAAFVTLAYAGFRIALGARDTYGRVLAGALTGMVVFQAIINMGAVTGLLPVKGIPLPLVSFGGTSVVLTMLSIGIVLSVSTYGARPVSAGRGAGKRSVCADPDERRRDSRSHIPGAGNGRAVARRRA